MVPASRSMARKYVTSIGLSLFVLVSAFTEGASAPPATQVAAAPVQQTSSI